MLLRLNSAHQFAVFEMGMNHLGEIAHLSKLAEPDVALIVMAGTAHIGELGSREAIAKAKGEIFGGLKPDGIAVINMHDRFGTYWRDIAGHHKILSFGVAAEDDLVGTFSNDKLTVAHGGESVDVALQLPGEHNQRNALAAAAGAIALGVSLATIKRGLENFSGIAGRLSVFSGHHAATIIDDTYNANPDSVKAAIKVLAAKKPPRILVLGDMGELGANAPAMHREVGEFARAAGIEKLYALGELSRESATAFGAPARHFESVDALSDALLAEIDATTSVLVKGSRFMRMERVVARLVNDYHGLH
jgi:UDP-N-acetylmuramoyl-tripeptide--D-alanyl-D-alanine ligase